MTITALWGVYHAKGGLLGELAYAAGKQLGIAHCALCEITHGAVRMKPAFAALQRRVSSPFHLVHLNEQSAGLAEVTRGRTPCVVAEVAVDGERRWTVLLTSEHLERCAGSVEAFEDAIRAALAAAEEDRAPS